MMILLNFSQPRSPDDIIKSIRGINEKISALEVNR